MGSDVGWTKAVEESNLCDIVSGDYRPIVAILEVEGEREFDGDSISSGLVRLTDPDIRHAMWTNTLECCGADSCRDLDGDGLPDCGTGEAVNETPFGADRHPGMKGYDDDGDGYVDFDDPDVINLLENACRFYKECDCDESYDQCSGIPSFIFDLAAEDDDENGYIDDVHGVDLIKAREQGPRGASTHPDKIRGELGQNDGEFSRHATTVASTMVGALDNGYKGAGVNASGYLMTISTEIGGPEFELAMGYAKKHGAEIVNMSFNKRARLSSLGIGINFPGVPAVDVYSYDLHADSKRFARSFDRTSLYSIASGNERKDLRFYYSLADCEDGNCPACDRDGSCFSAFPASAGIRANGSVEGFGNVLRVGASSTSRQFSLWSLNSLYFGSNYSTVDSLGNHAVDMVAPGEAFEINFASAQIGLDNGTSFSAPLVAAAAALVYAKKGELRRQPDVTKHLLTSTASLCSPPATDQRSCAESSGSGILDIPSVLGAQSPLLPEWADVSWQLPKVAGTLRSPSDLRLFRGRVGTDLENPLFLLEIHGGQSGRGYHQKLFRKDAGDVGFKDVSVSALGDDGVPLIGNYMESAIADFDGDGCNDIVLAGYVRETHVGVFRGEPDHLLLQRSEHGRCLGAFRVATFEPGGNLGGRPLTRLPARPTQTGEIRDDVSIDIDVIDINFDSFPDLVIGNAFDWDHWEERPVTPGHALGHRLLLNSECPDGRFGCFVPVLGALPLGADAMRLTVCDITGDERSDIITSSPKGPLRLWIADGVRFVDRTAEFGIDEEARLHVSDVACSDMTGDGLSDLFLARGLPTANENVYPDRFLENLNGSAFMDRSSDFTEVGDPTLSVLACDVDRDGVNEIILGNGNSIPNPRFVNERFNIYSEEDRMEGVSNRVLDLQGSRFVDVDNLLGFRFSSSRPLASQGFWGITEEVSCELSSTDSYVVLSNKLESRPVLFSRK